MSFNLKGDPDPESCAEPTTKRVSKFGKCSSLSSVRTASEGYLEEQTLCRKINLAQKETFIQMITEDNLNMKEAARRVSISYSTAKKIYSRFRHQLKKRLVPVHISATVRTVATFLEGQPPTQAGGVEVISTIGGREQSLRKDCA